MKVAVTNLFIVMIYTLIVFSLLLTGCDDGTKKFSVPYQDANTKQNASKHIIGGTKSCFIESSILLQQNEGTDDLDVYSNEQDISSIGGFMGLASSGNRTQLIIVISALVLAASSVIGIRFFWKEK